MKFQTAPFLWENLKVEGAFFDFSGLYYDSNRFITANNIHLDILQIPALEFLPLITNTCYYPSNILRKRYMKVSPMLRTHGFEHKA